MTTRDVYDSKMKKQKKKTNLDAGEKLIRNEKRCKSSDKDKNGSLNIQGHVIRERNEGLTSKCR